MPVSAIRLVFVVVAESTSSTSRLVCSFVTVVLFRIRGFVNVLVIVAESIVSTSRLVCSFVIVVLFRIRGFVNVLVLACVSVDVLSSLTFLFFLALDFVCERVKSLFSLIMFESC